MFNSRLIILAVLAHLAQSASKFVELKTEACTRENDPGCDHICVVNPIYGPLCACHFGYVVSSMIELLSCLKTCQIFTVPLECAEQSPINSNNT